MLFNQQLDLRILATLAFAFSITLSSSESFSQVGPIPNLVQVERITPDDFFDGDVFSNRSLDTRFAGAEDCFVVDNHDATGSVSSLNGIQCQSGNAFASLLPFETYVIPGDLGALSGGIETFIQTGSFFNVLQPDPTVNAIVTVENDHQINTRFRVVGREDGGKDDGMYTRRIKVVMTGVSAIEPNLALEGIGMGAFISSGPVSQHSFSANFDNVEGDWNLFYQYRPVRGLDPEVQPEVEPELEPCRPTLVVENTENALQAFVATWEFEDIVEKDEVFDVSVNVNEYYYLNNSFEVGGNAGLSNLSVTCDIVITDNFTIIPGDINHDCVVNFLDIGPFLAILASGGYDPAADLNCDGVVNFLDIQPFIDILTGN